MRWSNRFRAVLLIAGFFVGTASRAQSQTDEIGPLPTALSSERLQALAQLNPVVAPASPQPRARRRLPIRVIQMTPEEVSYREAVQKLGVDKHRFVHCELSDGKVRTGVITQVRDEGFMLKDGIIFSKWIRYTDLKAAPRPVAAVGTRIGQGFEWVALVAGCIAVAPVALVYYPLVAAGVIAD